MRGHTSKKQKAFLLYLKWNPGACAADVIAATLKEKSDLATNEHRALRGLRRRGFVRSGPMVGERVADGRVHRGLYITDKGLEAIR